MSHERPPRGSAAGFVQDGFIAQQMRRISRNLFFWNGLVLALLVLLLWLMSTYYYLFFRGPKLASDEMILKLAQQPGVNVSSGLLDYIELKDRQLIATGYQAVSTQDDKVYSTNPYWFTPVGDKLLLVMTEPGRTGQHLIGPIGGITGKADHEAYLALLAKRPDLKDKLLPLMLNDAAAFTVFGYVGFFLFIPPILLCLWNISCGMGGLSGLFCHPVGKVLRRLGDAHELAAKIDHEVADGPAQTIGKATITSLWLLRPTVFGMITVPLAEIVWAYHLILSGDHMAVICSRNGKALGISLKHNQVPQLLAELYTRIPWVLRGYDLDRLKQWRKRPADVVALADAERQLHLAAMK